MGSDFPFLPHLMPHGPPHRSEIVRQYVLPLHSKGWDYMRVRVPKTQGPNYPSMCNIFGLKIRPKLEIGFPKLSGVYSWMRTDIIWQEKWGHSSATSFLPYLWPGPLCTIFCSWLLGSHGFEVSWSWTLASIQPSWTIKEVQINNPSLSLRIKYHVQELQTLDNLPTNATYS